jgi:neutral ceramidase
MTKSRVVLELTLWLMVLPFAVEARIAKAATTSFRASCVKANITPDKRQWLLGYKPRESEGVHDNLYHRIVALDDGRTQFFLISTDLALISPSFYDGFCKELEQETGIKAQQVWWTFTHTHSAPEVGPPGLASVFLPGRYLHEPNPEYSEWVRKVLMGGIKEARSKLEPARLGVGTGMSMANINRRAKDVDGNSSLGLNPDGPVDRQIGLIRLERSNGSLLALIANYAMHGTVLGDKNLQISGDAPGIVAEYVEKKLGAPMLYINGAAGNIAPIYSVYPDFKSGHITQFNVLLGDRILAANRLMGPTTQEVTLWIGEKMIETPRKAELGWAEDLGDYLRVTSGGTRMVRIPVRFLKINNETAIWAAPLELFCEVAMNIRNQSPYAYTFYFGYCNGWLGYLPTEEAFAEGGYEPSVSPFTKQAEKDFTQGVITYLLGLPRE